MAALPTQILWLLCHHRLCGCGGTCCCRGHLGTSLPTIWQSSGCRNNGCHCNPFPASSALVLWWLTCPAPPASGLPLQVSRFKSPASSPPLQVSRSNPSPVSLVAHRFRISRFKYDPVPGVDGALVTFKLLPPPQRQQVWGRGRGSCIVRVLLCAPRPQMQQLCPWLQ